MGTHFPNVDTPLLYPFKKELNQQDLISNRPLLSPVSAPPPGEIWADVLFPLPAEYPDELTIEVSVDGARHVQCGNLQNQYT